MSEAGPLCPRCGELLDRDGVCFGESPDASHAPVRFDLDDPSGRPDVGRIVLDGDNIIKPWRYK